LNASNDEQEKSVSGQPHKLGAMSRAAIGAKHEERIDARLDARASPTDEGRYRRLVEWQQELVIEIGPDRGFLYVNPSCCRTFGKQAHELIGGSYLTLVHETERQHAAARVDDLAKPPHRCYLEQRLSTQSGWRWFGWSYTGVLDANGQLTSIVGVGREISSRKQTEKILAEVNERLALALEGGDIGLYTADRPLGAAFADARYFAMLGYAPGGLRLDTETWPLIVHPDDWEPVSELAQRVLRNETDAFEAEFRMRHRDGHWVWILDRAQVYARDANGVPTRTAGTHMDVSRRKEAELKLNYLADHDELTSLLNRRGSWQAIQRIHADSGRSRRPYALAIVDLDHFKQVNDTYGHAAGDKVLRSVAETLRSSVRESDWIGRWGGEEFVVALPGATEVQGLMALDRLRKTVAVRPIEIDGRPIQVTVSVGFAISRARDDGLDAVLARADQALYRAKEAGRNQVCYSGSESGADAFSTALLVQTAIETNGVLQAFQPVVDLRSRLAVGEQALARIISTDVGVMPAARFIDLTQQMGLLHRVDVSMFRAMLRRLAPTRVKTDKQTLEFLNVSGDLISRPESIRELANEIAECLEGSTGPSQLVLTISELQMKADTEQIAEALAPLLEQGCRLAISDFGSQASSVCFLTQLPVDFVGIDTKLVRLAAESPRARAFLAGIRGCARDLGIKTIAKQVDDEATAERLIELGIDWGRGRLFGVPSEPVSCTADGDG
jgi:diguanylate cyclase (GGDEF)-like protein/PAS domain S-box-containing protein